ncbi:MAG: ParA family protein [Pseudomonadota bacterium]
MFTIAIVNQKGGSGKSTLAECLAVAATEDGQGAAILDLDPQGTVYAWSKRREAENPPVLSVTAANYKDQWQALDDAGADLVIIDTPARLQDTVLNAADIADLVIVPAKATIKDIERVEDSIKLACMNSAKPTFVVFNQVRPQKSRSEDAEAAIKAQRFPVCPVRIGFRVAFEDSDMVGQTPLETEPSGKAAEEIRQLYAYVKKLTKQIEVDKSTGGQSHNTTPKRVANG